MDYVRLGNTGLKVSQICLGCMTYGSPQWRPWVLDAEAAKPFFRKAVEGGINFFDTADMYSLGQSEVVTGRWLKEFARREETVIATKVFFPHRAGPNTGGLSRKHILDAIDRSLKNLGTDHVDLYQIHRFDPETPIEETLEALHDVVKAGKARYIGASSMYAWQFAKMLSTAERHGWTRFISMQPQYNLVYREEEREMLPLCQSEGIGVIPWSPLARGFLAGGRAKPGEARPSGPGPTSFHPASITATPTMRWSRPSRPWRPTGASATPRSPWPGSCATAPSRRPSSAPRNCIIWTRRLPPWT